jgi:hypothetical protein
MSQKSSVPPMRVQAEKLVRDIRHASRKHHSAEEKIRIVLEGLRGEESRGPVPPRSHRREPVLRLVKGISRSQ